MKEAELITQLQKLRKIQPRKDWILFTKTKILGDTPRVSPFVFFKPALAGALALGLLSGLFFISQNALPDELLYPIKKLSEKTQKIFVSEEKRPEFQLKLTEKRLAELQEIVEKNDIRKFSSALSELSASKAEAKKAISKVQNNPDLVEKIAPMVKKNGETESKTRLLMGIGKEEEKEPAGKLVADYLIKDLEKSSLTERQKELLEKAKEYFEEEDYSSALSKAWEASQIK